MENFVTIGDAANKLVARLRAELRLPCGVILFTPNATTNIGNADLPKLARQLFPALPDQFSFAWLEQPMHKGVDARANAPDHVRLLAGSALWPALSAMARWCAARRHPNVWRFP